MRRRLSYVENGADITKVRKLFRDDMEDYKAKAEAVREVEMFHERYAISVCPSDMTGNPTVIAAQAANELLGYSRHSCIICDDRI